MTTASISSSIQNGSDAQQQSPPPLPGTEGLRSNWVRVAAPKNKQWTTAMDGVDKLKLAEADLPTPGDGEVLVRIHTVSLNYRDVEVCEGVFNHFSTQAQTGQSLVPCSDMCGTVVDVSHSSSRSTGRFKPGDRVLAIFLQSHLHGDVQEEDLASALGGPLPGVLAQYRCFPAESLVAAPSHLSDAEACCLPLAAATAWTALNWMRPLVRPSSSTNEVRYGGGGGGGNSSSGSGSNNRSVLLQGTTAVALAGLQMAKAAGLTAVITGPTDDFAQRAKDELGADEAINYQTHWAWEGDVLRATGGRGADIIFETGGGDGGARTLGKSFKCVAFGGLINCIGSPSGRGDDDDGNGGNGGGGDKTPKLHRLNVNALALTRNVTIRGVLNGGRDRLEEALAFYAEHGIKPVVDATYAFDKAGEALAYVKKGKHFGKVVITVGE
ncbi:hypothetical protein V2A60_002637 [Cordyceps javanica]|uniref:Zinc-type alcohol dehydrogenase-like protein n=1 Tax=Cordyceps javanica TaxID=43265 RepID=A0A545VWV7_9HYPO|nr:zinc-type alcohol dehydrogenase-like protein [Cordyceps javanica]TQW06203.1 zinc-type alcohol dehydrogenase-like protein [Cordyceps javanica]